MDLKPSCKCGASRTINWTDLLHIQRKAFGLSCRIHGGSVDPLGRSPDPVRQVCCRRWTHQIFKSKEATKQPDSSLHLIFVFVRETIYRLRQHNEMKSSFDALEATKDQYFLMCQLLCRYSSSKYVSKPFPFHQLVVSSVLGSWTSSSLMADSFTV